MSRLNLTVFYLLVWLTLTSTSPFIFYVWPGHPYKYLTFSCLLLMILLLLFKTKKLLRFDMNLLIIIILQISFFLVTAIIYKNYSNINLSIQLLALFIIIVFIDNFIGFEGFLKSYIYFMLVMGIGGTITFLIHLFIGIPPLFHIPYSDTSVTYFIGLTTTNEYYNVEGIRLIRYAGFFDEPGTYALYSLFAIIINKIYFQDRKVEYWLIIVTAFTLSLAFYIIITIYLLLFNFKLSYFKYLIVPLVCLIIIFNYLNTYKGENNSILTLKKMTIERIKLDEKRTFVGNNRFEASLHDKKIFFQNPLLGTQSKEEIKGISFYYVFAIYGIIGSFFYYGLLVYFIFRILQMRGPTQIFFLKIFTIIMLNLFHRPDFLSVFTLIAIYSMIKYLDLYPLKMEHNYFLKY